MWLNFSAPNFGSPLIQTAFEETSLLVRTQSCMASINHLLESSSSPDSTSFYVIPVYGSLYNPCDSPPLLPCQEPLDNTIHRERLNGVLARFSPHCHIQMRRAIFLKGFAIKILKMTRVPRTMTHQNSAMGCMDARLKN